MTEIEPASGPGKAFGRCVALGALGAVFPSVEFFQQSRLALFLDFVGITFYFMAAGALVAALMAGPAVLLCRKNPVRLARLPVVLLGLCIFFNPAASSISMILLSRRFGTSVPVGSYALHVLVWLGVALAACGAWVLAGRAWSRGRSVRWAILGAAFALWIAGFLAVRNPAWHDPSGYRAELDRYPVPVTPRPAGKVLALCIDGATWEMLDPLLAAGRLPNLQRIIHEGVRAPLEAIPPYNSHEAWTSLFVGKLPGRTGIRGHLVVALPGVSRFRLDYRQRDNVPLLVLGSLLVAAGGAELQPIPATYLRCKPSWKVLSDHGRSVWVLGMPATWPALPVRGAMMTDRVYHSVWEVFFRHRDRISGGTWPESLGDEIQSRIVRPDRATAEEVRQFYEPDEGDLAAIRGPIGIFRREPVALFHRTFAMDSTVLDTFDALARKETLPDLSVLYLTGVDTACHAFFPHRYPERYPAGFRDGAEIRKFEGVIDRYWEFLDRRLAGVLSRFGDDATVLLLSDHGNAASPSNPVAASWHDRNAIFAARGPGLRRGSVAPPLQACDVAPLIYAQAGFPVPRDLDGTLRADLYVSPPNCAEIPSYDP